MAALTRASRSSDVPRTFSLPAPLQHLKVPFRGRRARRVVIPRHLLLLSQKLQHFPVSVLRRLRARLFVHRTIFLEQVVQRLHVPFTRRFPRRRRVPPALFFLSRPFQQLQIVNLAH